MSSRLIVATRDLLRCFITLNHLIPKGNENVPLGVKVNGEILTIICKSGCIYKTVISIKNENNAKYDLSILYNDITALLDVETTNVYIEHTGTGIYLYNSDFETLLPSAYSVVSNVDFEGKFYKPVSNTLYQTGISRILAMNLDKLYNKVQPLLIYNDVGLIKYPNVWVQVRTTGLPFKGAIDLEHAKLLNQFKPKEICVTDKTNLILKNGNEILMIPRSSEIEDNTMLNILEDLNISVKLNTDKYLERIRRISKITNKPHCKITLFENGIKTSVDTGQSSTSVNIGYCNGNVIQTFSLPMSVWLSYLRATNDGTVEFLVGGDKLCMRTPYLIIVTSVIL